MKSVFLVISALISAFSSSQSKPLKYRFAVDPPDCKSAVVIDSLLCTWNGSTVSYKAKCHSSTFVSEKRDILLRFTMAGTTPRSTVDVVHGTAITSGGFFEISGTFSYPYEPSMSWVFAEYKDVDGAESEHFLMLQNNDVFWVKEQNMGFERQGKQLLTFSEGKQ